jgi:hypothetical protein
MRDGLGSAAKQKPPTQQNSETPHVMNPGKPVQRIQFPKTTNMGKEMKMRKG